MRNVCQLTVQTQCQIILQNVLKFKNMNINSNTAAVTVHTKSKFGPTTKQKQLLILPLQPNRKNSCIALYDAAIPTNISDYNNSKNNLRNNSVAYSNNIISSNNNVNKHNAFYSLTPKTKDCQLPKSLRELEESRTGDEEECTGENDRFLFSGFTKRRKFLLFSPRSKLRVVSRKKRKNGCAARLVSKNGECLIRPTHVPNEYYSIYRNWFHLLIEVSWRSVLLIFAVGFLCSWLFFGFLYYIIVQYYDYGLLETLPESSQCIANVKSFVSAFLFSLESQHTIGYGVRYMTEVCPAAFIVLCVQLIFGVLLQTVLAGIVIAKILRPKKRKQEIRFSQSAVVAWPMDDDDNNNESNEIESCAFNNENQFISKISDQLSIASLASIVNKSQQQQLRKESTKTGSYRRHSRLSRNSSNSNISLNNEHKPVIMIRLADVQHRLYLAESHVRLYMATTKFNKEGKKELIGIKDMNVGYDNGTDRVLLLWPVLIRHIIDGDSPFYGMTPEKAMNSDFELIMTVEGIVEATGMTFQARTSFLPSEIKWGQRFVPIVTMNLKKNNFEVDYSLFDATKPCSLPCEFDEECDNKPVTTGVTVDNKSASTTEIINNNNSTIIQQTNIIADIDENADEYSQKGSCCLKPDTEDEYCRGGDANVDYSGSNEGDYDGGEKPLLVSHPYPHYHHHHHHFHQRHRNHSSSGFT